jgi:hypothetical protein
VLVLFPRDMAPGRVLGLLGLLPWLAHGVKYSLSSAQGYKWEGSNKNGSIAFPSTVPGSVHKDLVESGIVGQDLLYRYNEVNFSWIPQEAWKFSTEVDFGALQVRGPRPNHICPYRESLVFILRHVLCL